MAPLHVELRHGNAVLLHIYIAYVLNNHIRKKKMALQMVVMEEGSTTAPITTTENIGYDAVPPKRPPKAE